jgi:acyl CoA:acetate/3-ketoacid CoA transferase beta subunit
MKITRAEVCVTACADAWRNDGELLASPMGLIPSIGARLARATFAPDLLLTDGEACYVDADGAVEGYLPYRAVFDLVWSGRRHVMMGPSQLDRFGNANISAIGEFERPTRQLLGARGAPGNTVNHPTSYWVPRHLPRTFVPRVDVICGVGYDSVEKAGPSASRFHDLRRVVTNLAVLDFATPDHSMRLASLHPGVDVDEVIENTGFELAIAADVRETRVPSDEELRLIREVLDPADKRSREVAA